MAAILWLHNQKIGSHAKEVLRIMTLLPERKEPRDEDRKCDADRLQRIETDIRAIRDLMFEAFQRGRTD